MHTDPVTTKLLSTTDSSEWEYVRTLRLPIVMDHPQGLLRLGEDRYFVSSARFSRDASGTPDVNAPGEGYLIELHADDQQQVREVTRLALGGGPFFHPGGLATDGEHIYVPVSEYRADSNCQIYKIDAATMQVVDEPVLFPDHVGALSIDTERKRIFGMSWAARKIYVWNFDWQLLYMNYNPIQNVDYQDIDFVGGNTLACSGFSRFDLGGEKVEVGGIDLIDATTWLPFHRIMVTTRSHTGRLLCHNAFTHKLVYPDLFLAFIPDDDDDSRVEVYKV